MIRSTLEEFSKGGELEDKTLSNDILEVTFNVDDSSEGGFNAMYTNWRSARKRTGDTYFQRLCLCIDDVMRPMVESVYCRNYSRIKIRITSCRSIERTGWHD